MGTLKPSRSRRYHQGTFFPTNPGKYVGDPNKIYYRSGLELRVMKFFDNHFSVLKWCSEEITVEYFWAVDSKTHRYYPDFVITILNKSGIPETVMIEVKPDTQTRPPKQPKTKRQQKRYLLEMETYTKNVSKWKAAEEFCKAKGWRFMILTDRHILANKG